MSASQSHGLGFSEDQPIVDSPVLTRYLSPSSARSSEAAQSSRCFRSPVPAAAIGSPSLRLFLSPSLGRSMYTRRRNSPSARAAPSVTMSPANAHASVDIAAARRPPNAMTPSAGGHTSVGARGLPGRSRKRKLTSDLWDDFTPIYDEDERLIQGQCVHCEAIFQADKKSGSSQCRRHRLVCTEKAKIDELIGSMQPGDPAIPALKKFKFDREKAFHELVRMIVLHELPFRIVEYEGFRRFVASLNPSFRLMSRTTMKDDCMAEFEKQKLELLEVLKNIPSRVSLTADLWTSNQELGYICVTCHFVDNKWKLHKRIIKFASIETPHNATNLLNVMLKTMQDWGIEDKVCTITLDNAAVNDLMVSYVKSNLIGRKLLAGNGVLFHHRCAAHVMNLIVQDGLKVSCGAVDSIRDSVKYVRSSSQRKERFEEIVVQLGITCGKKVNLDVCTRWNSTYLMLKTASEYITAFDQLSVQDPSYLWAPTTSQWKISAEICKLLVVFYDATLVVSGSLYPTSNTYFNAFWKIKWVLAKEASHENATIRSMVAEMKKIFVKYWNLSYLSMCIPVILDPRCKYKFLEFNLKEEKMIDGAKCLGHVKRTFKEMFNAYSSQDNVNANIQNEHQTQEDSMHDPWASWSQHVGEQQRHRVKQSELDMYLKEELVSPNASIDILQWWMNNTQKYPTISRMARDILAVPASTVASESAFSTGSRVISDYRSRLTSETVNALICLQDWMRPSGGIDLTTIVEDLENEDETLNATP